MPYKLLLVLSDTLLEVFRQFSELRPNMHVVSNQLIFNEAGIAVGHTQPLVHSYNKGKSPEQLAAVEPFIVVRIVETLCAHSNGCYSSLMYACASCSVFFSLFLSAT